MLRQCRRVLRGAILLGLMTGVLHGPCAAEMPGDREQAAQDVSVSRETTVQGIISRMGDTDVVIGDSRYRLAPGSGLSSSSFSQGQKVEGELDEKRRVLSLRRLSNSSQTAQPKATTKLSGERTKPAGQQSLILENGVWRNQ